MEMNRRVKDVSEVFDKQWNANHSYQEVKKQSEERKRHFNRMYQIEDISEKKKKILYTHSVDGKIKRLEENMRSADAVNRMGKMNNFKNNFR